MPSYKKKKNIYKHKVVVYWWVNSRKLSNLDLKAFYYILFYGHRENI